MEKVMPWKALLDLIEPYLPKTGSKGGRPPYPLATMLWIHLLQQWYDLSDPAMEDALIEVPTMRRFTGIDMISYRIPDETTILALRLLEQNDLGKQIFKAHFCAKGEHPFRVIKQQFSFQKNRLRGMLNNHSKVNVLAALSNLVIVRHRLLCST